MPDNVERVGLIFKEDGSTDFIKSLKLVNANLKESYENFKLTQAQWDKSTTTTQKLRDKLVYLNDSYDIQKSKVNLLKQELYELENAENRNEVAISKKRAQLTQAEASLQRYENQINETNNKLITHSEVIKDIGNRLEEQGNKIEKVGNKISVFSAASIAALTASAKSAIDFESDFTGVAKTVDATDEQLNKLKKDIRNLAKEIPASTTEISGVAEAAGQLGIATEDIMSFTRVMIDLGNSTNLSADEAATSLAKFANITKMSADNYSNLGSVIVALGNNFATTEKDIVEMATRLAATGELTGLTQSQIMALATSMSSVGIEAEAGGSAMSKLLKKIQVATETGGKDLENFSKVSGMTAEQFKESFEKDAVKALSAFISGLNDTERNGKSAIAILDDMNLNEVRLSNTILSLANSNDIMNDAIDLANKSWEENNALNKEASKRYDTLKSKIVTALNKLKDIGITIGNKLMPVIEKLLNKLDIWSKKFDGLNEKQIETIVKVGALVAALGPFLNIIGKITSTTGKFVKGISSIAEASGNLITKFSGSSEVTSNFFGNLSKITSLAGPVALAIGGISTAVVLVSQEVNKLSDNQRSLVDESNKIIESSNAQQTSYDELKKKKQEYLDTNLSEIEYTQKLYNELQTLVDENGKVKEGYEERVNYILTQLNNTVGTECKLNGSIIESYKDIQTEIQKTINLRKAEAIVEGEKTAWENAINNQQKAYETLNQLNKEYNATSEEIENLKKKIESLNGYQFDGKKSTLELERFQNQLQKMVDNSNKLEEEITQQQNLVENYAYDIATYEADTAALLSGTENDIQGILNRTSFTYKATTADIGEEIAKQIQLEQQKYDTYKNLYNQQVELSNETAATTYQIQMDSQQKTLESLADTLVKQTQTLGVEGPNITNAWQTLAENNFSVYRQKIGQLPEEMASIIDNTVTGASTHFSSGNETLVNAVGNVTKNMASTAKQNLNGKKWGEDLIDEMSGGLSNKSKLQLLTTKTNELAKIVKDRLGFSIPEKGPLSDFDKSMPDMIDLMVEGLKKSEPKLENETQKISENMKDNLETEPKQNISYNKITPFNASSNNSNFEVNEDVLYKAILKALTNCKIKFDKTGFIKIIDDRLLEVM